MIKNFDATCFKPVSYELRCAKIETIENDDLNEKTFPYALRAGEYVIISSIEELKMPSNLFAIVVPTSHSIRHGLTINGGKIDPTYSGRVSFGVQNSTNKDITIQEGDRLCHLLFTEFKGETIPLESKYFGDQLT